MSSSEIIKVVDETLSKHVTTSEGDCSKAFNKSLSEFLKAYAERSNNTRRALKLEEEPQRSEDFDNLENVANNISGITHRQLQVFVIPIFFGSSSFIYSSSQPARLQCTNIL